jgi:hypothetical protein
MWDTCAIDLKVELPRTVAAELAEVQLRDPELLGRMLMYAVARRRIFDRMCAGTLAQGDAAATSA